MAIRDFRDLKVWKLGKELVIDIYKITRDFPRNEQFGLVSQMRRCAVSIPSNIAEGFNRTHKRDNRRFLNMALCSCAELDTQTEISFELKFVDRSNRDRLLSKICTEAKMLRNLIKSIENSL